MIKINYTNKINSILDNKDIWEEEIKTINRESINKIKMELGGVQRRDLDIILLTAKSMREDESLPLVSFIGLFSMLVGILVASLTMFESYFWGLIVSFVIIILILLKVFTNRENKMKENNIKIKNIELAVIELLINKK